MYEIPDCEKIRFNTHYFLSVSLNTYTTEALWGHKKQKRIYFILMVLKFHLKVHFNLALRHNQQRQRDPLKAKASGLPRESKCRRTFFLVLGRQTHSGDPGAREGCWPGAGEDSDQSTSSLSQNGLKPKSLSTPLLL